MMVARLNRPSPRPLFGESRSLAQCQMMPDKCRRSSTFPTPALARYSRRTSKRRRPARGRFRCWSRAPTRRRPASSPPRWQRSRQDGARPGSPRHSAKTSNGAYQPILATAEGSRPENQRRKNQRQLKGMGRRHGRVETTAKIATPQPCAPSAAAGSLPRKSRQGIKSSPQKKGLDPALIQSERGALKFSSHEPVPTHGSSPRACLARKRSTPAGSQRCVRSA